MARSFWVGPLLVLLVVATLLTGCLSARPRAIDADSVAVGSSDAGGSAEKVRAQDVAAALWIAGAFLIVGAVIVDVLILPWAIPCHHCFCCTEEVVVVCYR